VKTEIIKGAYRKLVPAYIRQSAAVEKMKRLLPHNAIYDAGYYSEHVEGPAAASAGIIATSIIVEFKPSSVIDIGCGTGAMLAALRDCGCDVVGLEYSKAGLAYCRARNLNVIKFDLEKDVFVGSRTFDVAISMEVAEHLPESVAGRYVALLSQVARVVVLTAAHPGQRGNDHVNLQPRSYWVSMFQRQGFTLDEDTTERWRSRWQADGVARFYCENLMLFRKQS